MVDAACTTLLCVFTVLSTVVYCTLHIVLEWCACVCVCCTSTRFACACAVYRTTNTYILTPVTTPCPCPNTQHTLLCTIAASDSI